MKKRILSMLLALVMVLSLVPTTVFAAGAGEDGWIPVPTGIQVTYNAAENTSTRELVNNNTETYGNTEYKIPYFFAIFSTFFISLVSNCST